MHTSFLALHQYKLFLDSSIFLLSFNAALFETDTSWPSLVMVDVVVKLPPLLILLFSRQEACEEDEEQEEEDARLGSAVNVREE